MATGKPSTINVGIIILAAGASSRLGRAKQLLPYNSQTLLEHTIQTAVASRAQPVVVVLGAEADAIQLAVMATGVHIAINEGWKEGMASSIRCGLQSFIKLSPAAEGVILMVCDQPFLTTLVLNNLVEAHQQSGKPVVASGYDDNFGTPVFFHRSLFDELLQLKGDVGAKRIVGQHADAVEVIPFPDGKFDVDTEADYEHIKSEARHDRRQL